MTTDTVNKVGQRRSRSMLPILLLIVGALSSVAVLFLWWLGTVSAEADPEVGRVVFAHLPGVFVAAFYLTMSACLFLSAYLFAQRARNWTRGGGEDRTLMWKRRVHELRDGLTMKTLLRDRSAGLMHAAIYYGFIVLFLGTVTLEVDHLLPSNLKFLKGGIYQAYSLILDSFALSYLAGICWAAVRRWGTRPWRIRSKTKLEDVVILATLGLIGLTGLFVEAARISLIGRPDWEVFSYVGYALSYLVPHDHASGWYQVFWATHALLFAVFLVVLPVTKLRHAVTSPVNMFLSPRGRPKGAMRAVPNLREVVDIESVGAARVDEFTWKQLFDTDACTMCGRCTEVCPPNITGKPLDPREIVLKLGEVAALTAADPVSPPVGVDGAITVTSDAVFERVTPDELWACTTCRACDEACPVGIEIVDKILDMRRHLSSMEADFPNELGRTYVSLENSSNVYGMNQATRGDWTAELDFPVKVLGDPGVEVEYLYWVGCAGAFDDRNRKVTLATARLLATAGVDFAILGPRELCSGDPARRTGNEYVYQGLALQNIETLNDLGITKIITQCPHCFNTLRNEYPQLGGDYEVFHHSEILSALVAEGRIATKKNLDQKVTYHDPCYLGRYNDVYVAPRDVLGLSENRVEMPRNGTNSFCCGAGGGRMWTEEKVGKKVNVERSLEAVATGASVIATGCPFCFVMMDDGIKEIGAGETVAVKDLAIVLEENLADC